MAKASGVRWPFEGAQIFVAPTLLAAGAQTIEIVDTKTILSFPTLTAATTINLSIDSEVLPGAELVVIIPATATEVATFGTGFTAPTVTGVAGKTKTQLFVYDGVTFKPVGVAYQIN